MFILLEIRVLWWHISATTRNIKDDINMQDNFLYMQDCSVDIYHKNKTTRFENRKIYLLIPVSYILHARCGNILLTCNLFMPTSKIIIYTCNSTIKHVE